MDLNLRPRSDRVLFDSSPISSVIVIRYDSAVYPLRSFSTHCGDPLLGNAQSIRQAVDYFNQQPALLRIFASAVRAANAGAGGG